MDKPHTEEPRVEAVDTLPRSPNGAPYSATQVLQQLATTLAALNGFIDAEQSGLDPWEATSLAVTEQSLQRAWLAFSQLHTDLLNHSRKARTH